MLRNFYYEVFILLKETQRRFYFIGHNQHVLQFNDLVRQLILYREKNETVRTFSDCIGMIFTNLIAYTSLLNLSFAGFGYVCVLLAIYSVVIIYRHSRPPPTLLNEMKLVQNYDCKNSSRAATRCVS